MTSRMWMTLLAGLKGFGLITAFVLVFGMLAAASLTINTRSIEAASYTKVATFEPCTHQSQLTGARWAIYYSYSADPQYQKGPNGEHRHWFFRYEWDQGKQQWIPDKWLGYEGCDKGQPRRFY